MNISSFSVSIWFCRKRGHSSATEYVDICTQLRAFQVSMHAECSVHNIPYSLQEFCHICVFYRESWKCLAEKIYLPTFMVSITEPYRVLWMDS